MIRISLDRIKVMLRSDTPSFVEKRPIYGVSSEKGSLVSRFVSGTRAIFWNLQRKERESTRRGEGERNSLSLIFNGYYEFPSGRTGHRPLMTASGGRVLFRSLRRAPQVRER